MQDNKVRRIAGFGMDIRTEKTSLSQTIFLIGLFVKQFYLLPSGSFQIGDLLLMLGCGLYLIESKGGLKIDKQENKILLYFVCITVINLVCTLVFDNTGFMKSIMYYAYNILVIIFFSSNISFETNNRVFLEKLSFVFKASLITQLVILLTGVGSWYASVRYQGTFNDPNQYGVFILFSIFGIYIINTHFKKRTWYWIALGFVLIFMSASTGNTVACFVFAVVMVCMKLRSLSPTNAVLAMTAVVALTGVWIALMVGWIELPEIEVSNYMLDRIMDKITLLFEDSDSGAIIDDRGWNRFFENPEYLLFGAGEGYHQRFGTELEIHSSILGPLFYYGIVPFLIFVSWVVSKLKGLDKSLWCVYIALLAEAFFLVNTRQPMFWMLIVLAGAPILKESD